MYSEGTSVASASKNREEKKKRLINPLRALSSADGRRGTGLVDRGGGKVLQAEGIESAEARTRKEATVMGLTRGNGGEMGPGSCQGVLCRAGVGRFSL